MAPPRINAIARRRLYAWFLIKYRYIISPTLAKSENKEIHNFNPVPGSKPNAMPGFSIKVRRKKSPIIGILSPWYIPSYLKLMNGIEKPLTKSFVT
jgi:hypothetical protein